MKRYFLILAVILFASCHKEANNHILKIGKTTEIKLGETAYNAQYGLSLSVENIQDSRCPNGATCVWAGYASVQLHLTTKLDNYDFTLYTLVNAVFKNDTIIESFKYKLIDVVPYPVVGEKPPVKTVKILVSR